MIQTLQFHTGGLLDAEPITDVIHLAENPSKGTLCGIGLFGDAPGWSRGGGIGGEFRPCGICARVNGDAPVSGRFSKLFDAGEVPG